MRCIEVVERATDYLEGAGGRLQRLRIRVHLAGCEPCRTHFEQLQDTRRLLRGLAQQPDDSVDSRDAALRAFRSR